MLSASVRFHASADRQNAYVIYTAKDGTQFGELPYFVNCTAECVNQNGWKFSSFLAVLVDDADTLICSASKTKDFLVDWSLVWIEFHLPPPHMVYYLFSTCVEQNLLFGACSVTSHSVLACCNCFCIFTYCHVLVKNPIQCCSYKHSPVVIRILATCHALLV